jgi:hypothetical protein
VHSICPEVAEASLDFVEMKLGLGERCEQCLMLHLQPSLDRHSFDQ